MINVNITNVRQELYKYANSCLKYNDVINISTKEGNVVMISRDAYDDLLESITLASIHGFYKSVAEGVKTPIKECKKISWK